MANPSLPPYPSGPDGDEIRRQGGDGIAVTPYLAGMYGGGYKVIVTVNQASYEIPWDQRSVLWLPRGQYHVRVHVQAGFRGRTGSANYTVQVGGGHPAELEYRFLAARGFGSGALGPPPLQANLGLRNILFIGLAALLLTAVIRLVELLG